MKRDLFKLIADTHCNNASVGDDARFAPQNSVPRDAFTGEQPMLLPHNLRHLYILLCETQAGFANANTPWDIQDLQVQVAVIQNLLRHSIEHLYPPRLKDEKGKQYENVEIGLAKGWQVYHIYGDAVPLSEIPCLVIVRGEAFVEEESGHGISAQRSYEAFTGISHQRRKPFDVH